MACNPRQPDLENLPGPKPGMAAYPGGVGGGLACQPLIA